MIINYSLLRLSVIFLLVILFPLVQKQWQNLYLFDINNFTIYKILYYLIGLICPILVIKNSLNKFTLYKFNSKKVNNIQNIRGKSLFFLTSTVLFILSILISSYIFINLSLFQDLFASDNKILVYFDIEKQILLLVFISILLLFRKFKLFIKKGILINFFMMSLIIWYSEISNKTLNDSFMFDILKIENINIINLLFLLLVEIFYYLWSYISYGSYLSDWSLPKPYKKEVLSISNIILFYLLILFYYSVLF